MEALVLYIRCMPEQFTCSAAISAEAMPKRKRATDQNPTAPSLTDELRCAFDRFLRKSAYE